MIALLRGKHTGHSNRQLLSIAKKISGLGWSPPPMGFYLWILIKWSPPQGGTQVTDFNKGFTKGMFTTNIRRRSGGVRGAQTPLSKKEVVRKYSEVFDIWVV